MRTTIPRVFRYTFAVLAFILLFQVAAEAQRKAPEPVWYYPAIDQKFSERGDFSELKDKRRVYVSFFHGATPPALLRQLQEQVFQQLRQYDGLEIVDKPESADLAIHISTGSLLRPRPGSGHLSERTRTQDVSFFVLLKGKDLGSEIYNPRVIVRRTGIEEEGSTGTFASLQVGSFIKSLKKLRGE